MWFLYGYKSDCTHIQSTGAQHVINIYRLLVNAVQKEMGY